MSNSYRLDIQVSAHGAEAELKRLGTAFNNVVSSSGQAGDGVTRFESQVSNAAKSVDKLASKSKPLENGLSKLKNNLDDASDASKRLNGSLNSLSPVMGSLAKQMTAIVTIGSAISRMDNYTGLQNRLKLVTKDTNELNEALKATYQIAQNTGSDWDSAVMVFQKFSENAQKLNLSLAQTAKLTDTVSKAVAISGSSAESASAALVQFGQGLGSGVLRGDEFNSVNENANGIIKALAYGLGVTSDELRKMAAEGKLTGDVLAEALDKAQPYIDEMFAKTDFTVGQSMQMLSNAMTQFVGEAGKASGAASLLSNTIQLLANNFNAVANTMLVAGIGYATYAIAQKTQAVYGSVTALIAERAANAQKAQSELVAAQSEMATTTAKLAKVRASTQAIAVMRGEAVAQAQLTAATNAHTAAQARLQAAQGAVIATSTGLRGIMAGLLGAMGGPLGLAITVGGVAASYLLLKDNAKQADDVLQENKKTVAELSQEYQKLSENHKQLKRDQALEEVKNKTRAYEEQINALEKLANKIAFTSRATAEQKLEVLAAAQAFRDKTITAEELAIKIREMGVASENLSIKLTEQAHQTAGAKQELEYAESVSRAYEGTAYNAADASASLANQMDGVASAANNAANQVAGLTAEAQRYMQTIGNRTTVDTVSLKLLKKGYSPQVARGLAEAAVANNGTVTPAMAQQILKGATAKENLEKYLDAIKPKSGSGGRRSSRSGGSSKSSSAKSASKPSAENLITKAERQAWERVKQNAIKYNFAGLESQYNLPPGILSSVHMQESRGNAQAVGPQTKYGRAKGGFQFIDDTWKSYGKGSVFDLANAAPAAAKYLRDLIDQFGDYDKAIAAYNTGPGNVKKHSWELIMSNRYARMKNGKGQTHEYVKNVNRYMQAYNGGSLPTQSASDIAKQASDFAKEQAELQKRLVYEFANSAVKAQMDLDDKLAELQMAGFDSETQEYFETLLKERFELTKSYQDRQTDYELYGFMLSAKERLEFERDLALSRIDIDAEMTDEQKAYQKQAIIDKYNFDVLKHREAQAKKVKDLQKLVAGVSQGGHAQAMIDIMNQRSMSSLNYGKWQIDQRMVAREIEQKQRYANTVGAINEKDELGNFAIESAEERYRLLEEAATAHLEEMKAIHERAAEEMRQHEQDHLSATLQAYSATFGAMAGLFKGMVGEQSKAYRLMFAASKAFALAEAGMNVYTAASDAYAKHPGTVWQKIWAATKATMDQGKLVALINAINPKGFRSGGYTGNMGVNQVAGVVHGKEYVLNASATKRIGKDTLDKLNRGANVGGSVVNITIENHTNATIKQETDSNGDIRLIVGEELAKQLPQHVNNPYSEFNKSLKQNYQLQRRL